MGNLLSVVVLQPSGIKKKKILTIPDTFNIKSLHMYFLISSGVLLRCIVHYH